jgi:hypothetical protein
MLRRLLALSFLCLLASCTKPALPDLVVRATTSEDLAAFRSDLAARFTAQELELFDTAIQELKLDAMNRNVAPASAREADMLAVANGKSVHVVTLLGWQARKARFLRDHAELTQMLERDLLQQARTAATGTPESVITRIQSEREVIARLQRDLAETELRLAALSAPPK